jgi:uncharacterized membrane-anchored protein
MSFVELTGHAKLDRRTKNLVKRLSADDIAIIDHTDLDRVSAEALLESGVRVVVNVAESRTPVRSRSCVAAFASSTSTAPTSSTTCTRASF